MTNPMTVSKFELMRHALGVQSWNGRWKKPYRNHFAAGDDHIPLWDELVADGFATKRAGGVLTDGCPTYYVTDAGKEQALAGIAFKRRWGYGQPANP